MFILSGETLSRKCSLFKGSLNCTPQASRASLVPFPCDSMLWQVKAILELKPNPAWRLRYRGACKQKNIKKIMRLLGDSFSQNHPHSTTVNKHNAIFQLYRLKTKMKKIEAGSLHTTIATGQSCKWITLGRLPNCDKNSNAAREK